MPVRMELDGEGDPTLPFSLEGRMSEASGRPGGQAGAFIPRYFVARPAGCGGQKR